MDEYKNNGKLSFEWHSLLRDILHNAWVIVLAAIVGFILTYVSGRIIYRPVYTSSATLIVNVKTGTYQAYTNLAASSEMAEIFTEVFVQPSMKEKASEYLGNTGFTGELKASVLQNTNIINLSVTAKDPEVAYNELVAIIEVYPQISDTIFSNAVVDVMRSPEVPRSPSNAIPNSYKTVVVGAVVLIVLMAILVLSLMRDTVKSEAAFNKKVGAKLIGTVVHERKYHSVKDLLVRKKSSLLIDNAFTSFRFSESYQKIASKIEYMNRNNGDKVFLFTSVAENEGKSTVAINTSLALASRGKKVVLLDMDFMKPAIKFILNLKFDGENDFGSFLSNGTEKDGLKLTQYKNSRLYVAVNNSRHSDYVDWINSARVKELLDELSKEFDYVIIDTPPMFAAAEVASVSRFCDKSVLVVRTDFVQTADVNDAIMILSEDNHFAGCVFNDVYDEFSFFGQTGANETGYTGGYYSSYGGYSKYVSSYSASLGLLETENDDKN